MKMILFILTLIVSLFAEKILPITELEQRKDQWCWAGSSTAILTYYGEKVSQGQIVQFALSKSETGTGDSTLNAWNYLWTSGTTRSSIVYNGTQFYGFGINHIMTKWNTPHEYGNYNLTEAQYKSEINDGHPFVIRWGWTSGGGHFVVGQGYLDNGNYQIMDPWFGNGYTVNSYNWINTAQGGQGNWTHTMTTDRSIASTTYQLTISGGTGSGSYEAAKAVAIAATVPAGKEFVKWSGAGSAINDSLKAAATITMPAKAITVTAVYKDVAVPTYVLTISGGSGSGSYAEAKAVAIAATVPSGKEFVKWSGAGSAINDSLKANAIITMPSKALTVMAVLGTVENIDTSDLSDNFVTLGSWECAVDQIGSQVTIDSSNVSNAILTLTMAIAADNELLGEEGFAWGNSTVSVGGIYDSVNFVKVSYSSTDSIRIVLNDSILAVDGVSFEYTLPPTKTMRIVCIPVSKFSQPDWCADSLKQKLNLTRVQSLSIEAVESNKTTEVILDALQLNMFIPEEPVEISLSNRNKVPSIVVQTNSLILNGYSGLVRIKVFGLNGRLLHEQNCIISKETVEMKLPYLGSGIHILSIQNNGIKSNMKLTQ